MISRNISYDDINDTVLKTDNKYDIAMIYYLLLIIHLINL